MNFCLRIAQVSSVMCLLMSALLSDAKPRQSSFLGDGVREPDAQSTTSWEPFESRRPTALGFKRYTSTGGLSVWALHGLYQMKNNWILGAGFGFDADFDVVVFSAEMRKALYKNGDAGLFAEGSGGFLKMLKSHFIAGARLGFEYGISEKLKFDATYGLELMLGNTENHFGTTQPPDFAGSFGVHWLF